MRFRTLALCALVAGLVGVGCGDGTTSGEDGGPSGVDGSRGDGGADSGDTTRCGDGVVQRPDGEQCDDGNTVDGDGCSADCTSDETCGNGVLDTAIGELCDDSNTTSGDGCRADCLSDYRCGNGVVDTVTDGATADEVCDDGNTVNDDGCSAACDSDESCGNGIVDVGAGEVCDDGNTADGDDCSADCSTSLLCGNGALDGTEECDDGNDADGDGCNASCQSERCGNGRVDATEACDDANLIDGDGCDVDCTFTCSADADCADAEICNGTEACTNPGTSTSNCGAGTPAADGVDCGGGRICSAGACTTSGCGDATVSGGEDCDDGNTVSGDGCDADCTWTCDGAADCDDGNFCNGAETCSSGGTLASRCAMGTAPSMGTACDRDAMPGTRDVCRMSMCVASTCGDGYVDAGATPVEQCDDGNTANGDGCSSTCQTVAATPPTAFRMTNLDLISPRVVVVPLFGCQDVTQTPVAGISVNGMLDTAIQPMSMGGDYSLHILSVFRPYSTAAATTPVDLHFNSACDEATTPDSCGPDAVPDVVMATAMNTSSGSCFTPNPADVNTRAGTPTAYSPTVNTVSGPCFVTAPQTLTVTIAGIVIPLQDARVAATYSGTMATGRRLVSGVVTGFLSETAAADITLPADLTLIGGDPLYEHLQAGNRSVTNAAGTSVPDGCNVGGGAHEDDADMNGTTRGFWFFLNFTAEEVTWTGA